MVVVGGAHTGHSPAYTILPHCIGSEFCPFEVRHMEGWVDIFMYICAFFLFFIRCVLSNVNHTIVRLKGCLSLAKLTLKLRDSIRPKKVFICT
jgi:hypothetical protein